MNIICRQARIADIPGLCDLLSILFSQEAEFSPNRSLQETGLRMILARPEIGRLYCAVDGDRIIGMVSLLFTISTAEGGTAAWLEDMVVMPDCRGQGIGEKLLQTAIDEARTAGCKRITLLTDADNTSAMRFYGRQGFVRSPMVPLRRKL